MVEIRKLPLSDGWILVPRDRTLRPHDFRLPAAERLPTPCPFCAGREFETPSPLAVYPDEASEPWRVRVVPNKFPAVEQLSNFSHNTPASRPPLDECALDANPHPALSASLNERNWVAQFAHSSGRGVHEVVIESPRHATRFRDLTVAEASDTVRAYRDRLRAHRCDTRLAYSLAFRNSGITGGASLEHAHSQIIATEWIPANLLTELRYSRTHHQRVGKCLFCEMLAEELCDGRRLVAQTDSFVAWCPFASRFAYEVWIAPRRHHGEFDGSSDEQLADFTEILRDVVGRVERLPGSPGYNFWIHTSPFALREPAFYHWHVELIPRVSYQAAFEWGCGDFINAVPPEDAARVLREVA
ncbi:MAG: hypothetical protein U1A77_24260 [Pirellulales bacterium]